MAEEERDSLDRIQDAVLRIFRRLRLLEDRLERLEQQSGSAIDGPDDAVESTSEIAGAPIFSDASAKTDSVDEISTGETLDAEPFESKSLDELRSENSIPSTRGESLPIKPAASLSFLPTQSTSDANALERLVGGKLLSWLGAFVLIIAIAFFIPWAWQYFNIPDWVKVAGFHLLGVAILVAGHVTNRYRLPILAHALTGLGVFTLYATAFVTLHVYSVYQDVFGEHYRLVAFAECSIVTALAIAIALRTNSAVVIIIGALGGFLTPPVTSSGSGNYVGLFSYLAFLNVALIASAAFRKWSFLKPLSLIATAVMFGLWLMDEVHYTNSKAWPTEGFVILHAAIFLLGATIPPLVWKQRSNAWDLAALAANSLWFMAITRTVFRQWDNTQLALVSWSLCGLHAVLFGLTIARVTHADRMPRIHLALAGLFFVLAAPLQIDEPIYFAIAWTLQGTIFTAIGIYFADRQMLATACIVFFLALFRLSLDYELPARAMSGTAIDLRFCTIAASAVVMMITGTMRWWMPRRGLDEVDDSEDQTADSKLCHQIEFGSAVLLGLGNLVLLISLTRQWHDRLVLVLWSLDVAAIYAIGFRRNMLTVRWYAFALAITLLPVRTLLHLNDHIDYYTLLVNVRFGSMTVVAAVYFVAAWGYRILSNVPGSDDESEHENTETGKSQPSPDFVSTLPSENSLESGLGLMGHIVLAMALSFEVASWYRYARNMGFAPFPNMRMAELATYSILFAIYAAIVVVFGFWLQRKPYRVAGLIAFVPIMMKVFFVDLAQLEELPRVLATFALGIMLLAVSFAYQRFAARIFGPDE